MRSRFVDEACCRLKLSQIHLEVRKLTAEAGFQHFMGSAAHRLAGKQAIRDGLLGG